MVVRSKVCETVTMGGGIGAKLGTLYRLQVSVLRE